MKAAREQSGSRQHASISHEEKELHILHVTFCKLRSRDGRTLSIAVVPWYRGNGLLLAQVLTESKTGLGLNWGIRGLRDNSKRQEKVDVHAAW